MSQLGAHSHSRKIRMCDVRKLPTWPGRSLAAFNDRSNCGYAGRYTAYGGNVWSFMVQIDSCLIDACAAGRKRRLCRRQTIGDESVELQDVLRSPNEVSLKLVATGAEEGFGLFFGLDAFRRDRYS